jgi:hypothetical protein
MALAEDLPLEFVQAQEPDSFVGVNGIEYTFLRGDFDGNGRDDLIRRSASGSQSQLFFSSGSGAFVVRAPEARRRPRLRTARRRERSGLYVADGEPQWR